LLLECEIKFYSELTLFHFYM